MKRIISVLIIIIVLSFSFVNAESGDTYQDGYNAGYNAGYLEGKEKVYKPSEPNIILIESSKIQEVEAGEKFTLIIDYKNDSEYTAKNIKIAPVFEGSPLVYEGPITYEANSNLRSQRTDTAAFGLKIKKDAKNGIYPITFKISYKNTGDENYSKTGTSYIKVTGEKLKSIVTISNIVTEPEKIYAGQRFTVKFNVNNIGEIPMIDTYLKLTGFSVDTIMPADGADSAYIGSLEPNSSITKSFSLIASDNIPKGSNSLGVNIKYKNENKEEMTEEKHIYIFNVINNSKKSSGDDERISKPKIIIESYSTMPNYIVAGDSFVFNFRAKNTSREVSIKNMKITIKSNDGAFVIANGSNTFYVENLPPLGHFANSIKLNVKQGLTSKSYPVDISFDYDDDNYNSTQSVEVINIPVVEYSNLVINNATVNEALVDAQTSLAFDYINMGKAVISNLTASVSGDYKAVQPINYIGNIEAGNSDYYDIQVIPTKEGENVGTLILSFEDSSGKKLEVKRDFTGFAMVESDFEDEPIYTNDEQPDENNLLSVWEYIGIGIVSFLLSFFISKIITTRIIRKKLEDDI